MKRLSNYLIEKLVLNDKTKIRKTKTYSEDDFEQIVDWNEDYTEEMFEDLKLNLSGGYLLTESDNDESFLCGWTLVNYWDKMHGGSGKTPVCFLIVNEKQFEFFKENDDLNRINNAYGCYAAPDWFCNIVCKDNVLGRSVGTDTYFCLTTGENIFDIGIIDSCCREDSYYENFLNDVLEKLETL